MGGRAEGRSPSKKVGALLDFIGISLCRNRDSVLHLILKYHDIQQKCLRRYAAQSEFSKYLKDFQNLTVSWTLLESLRVFCTLPVKSFRFLTSGKIIQ